jgi:hypothetical protein
MARILRKAKPGATKLFAAHANYLLAASAKMGILAATQRRQAMTTYRIEHQHKARHEQPWGWTANIAQAQSAMAAVEWAAKTLTWARGHTDYELGVIWPFNPDMLVNGIPAYRVAAGEYGGSWATAATRRDAQAVAA